MTGYKNILFVLEVNNGFIIQYGSVQIAGTISSTYKRITFPITFSNNLPNSSGIIPSFCSQDANQGSTLCKVGWQSTTGMSIGGAGAAANGWCSWLVIGY